MQNAAFRAHLRNEVRKRFTGDPEALYRTLRHQNVGGVSFESHLARGLESRRARLQTSESVAVLAARIPRLHVGVFGVEEWQANSQIPLVAFAPLGVDDLKVERLKAYDADGNVHWLDGQRDPDHPVVVIGINERTDDEGKLLPGFRSGQNVEAEIDPCPIEALCVGGGGDDGGGGGGGGGVYVPPVTNRVLPAHSEKLVWIKVLDDNEPWWKFNCELKWSFTGSKVPSVPLHRDDKEDAVEGIQHNLNITAFYWVPADMGGFYAVQWLEDDWGGTASLGVTLTGKAGWPITNVTVAVPFTISAKDEDDDMGARAMHYDEPIDQPFVLSDIMWKLG